MFVMQQTKNLSPRLLSKIIHMNFCFFLFLIIRSKREEKLSNKSFGGECSESVEKMLSQRYKSCHRLNRPDRYIFKIKYRKLVLNYWTNTTL